MVAGVALIALAAGLYAAAPGLPELRQVDLTVLDERPDGRCEVRWRDPYASDTAGTSTAGTSGTSSASGEREGTYQCDPDRSSLLKGANYDPETGHGWDSGWVLAEGAHRGELYSLGQDDDRYDAFIDASDGLLLLGLLVTLGGLVTGGVRARPPRERGAGRATLRQAHRLRESAERVRADHRRATEAVVAAWAPVHEAEVRAALGRLPVQGLPHAAALRREGLVTVDAVREAAARTPGRLPGLGRTATAQVTAALVRPTAQACDRAAVRLDAVRPDAVRLDSVRLDSVRPDPVRLDAVRPDPEHPAPDTTALLCALRVLVAAGPETAQAVERARDLGARLTPELIDAAADPLRGGHGGPEAGDREQPEARAAARTLRDILTRARREHLAGDFAQSSVDLLRGADPDPEGIAARTDFALRPAAYYRALEEATRTADRNCAHRTGRTPA